MQVGTPGKSHLRYDCITSGKVDPDLELNKIRSVQVHSPSLTLPFPQVQLQCTTMLPEVHGIVQKCAKLLMIA